MVGNINGNTYYINNLPALSVIGNVTGNYFIGNAGIQYTANATTPPPTGNLIGAQWFNTTNNVLYEYQSDGTNKIWVDITSPVIGTNGAIVGNVLTYGASGVTVNNSNVAMVASGSNVVTVTSLGISVTGAVSATNLFQSPLTTMTSSSLGTPGQIAWDANYIYVCTATNTWKRIALVAGTF